jgi:hypothetical protein
MKKTLSMVSHRTYDLKGKWGFCNIFNFQVNHMLYWWFHFENEIWVNCLFTQCKWTYIYWILDLENKVHSIWDLWRSGLQECKGNGFFEVGRGGRNFQSGPENLNFFVGQLPLPASTSPERLVGVRISSAITNITLYEEDIHDNYTIGTHKPKAVNA